MSRWLGQLHGTFLIRNAILKALPPFWPARARCSAMAAARSGPTGAYKDVKKLAATAAARIVVLSKTGEEIEPFCMPRVDRMTFHRA
jgi:hypothetical protein